MRPFPSPASAVLAAALLFLPGVASAQPGPKPLLKLPALKPAEAAYRRQLGPYAGCLVGKANPELAEFLGAGAASREAARKAKRLAQSLPDCTAPGGRFAAAPLLLRGAVFEALYRRDFAGAAVPATLGAAPPMRYGGGTGGDETLATMRLGIFAIFDCAVRADPRRVAEMLGHPPESEGEAAAFEGLAPVLSGCRPRDLRLAFGPSFARPYVSEILYTLMLGARPGREVR